MDISREIDELVARADESAREERRKDAAFLFEQARRLALDYSEPRRAFELGVEAASEWRRAGEHERMLNSLLEALAHVPPDADPIMVYFARLERFFYYLYDSPIPFAQLRATKTEVAVQLVDGRGVSQPVLRS